MGTGFAIGLLRNTGTDYIAREWLAPGAELQRCSSERI
jgi:hypothetical protein